MKEYMTEANYQRHLELRGEFESILVACAQEISMISNGRELIGDFNGDIDIYDDERRYFVQFETWDNCGDDTDSVYVPEKYIYSDTYRGYHRNYLEGEKRLKEAERLERIAKAKVRTVNFMVDERAEYERLKSIYGDE